MITFALLLTSHIFGDVIFISHKLAIVKRSSRITIQLMGISLHAFIHSFFAGALLAFLKNNWFEGAVLVFVFHFFIDLIRSSTEMKLFGQGKVHVKRSEFFDWVCGRSKDQKKMNVKSLRSWFLINILDQGAHMISLYLISMMISQ